MQITSIDMANQALAAYVPGPRLTAGVYTLERMRDLMDLLGNPQNNMKVIHVAGTSGKTSTAYYIAALLKTSGKKVGLTVSPHIDSVNERVQLNMSPPTEEAFCAYLSAFLEILRQHKIKPTYFELMVAFAYWVFAKEQVDYAVVEVGLGGLLDGTNVVDRADKVCVITDIGLDHTEILGNTLGEIAVQKLGIVLPDNSVFMHQQADEIMKVAHQICSLKDAKLHEVQMSDTPKLVSELPLFQQRNWQLANSVYRFIAERDNLPMLGETQLQRTMNTYIPARMEIIQANNKTLIMDGSHNAQKLNTLVASIRERFPNEPVSVLLSFSQTDKNLRLEAALREVLGLADYVIITTFTSHQDMIKQAVDPAEITVICNKLNFINYQVIVDPTEAFRALVARDEAIHLVTGSFYMLNHVRPMVRDLF